MQFRDMCTNYIFCFTETLLLLRHYGWQKSYFRSYVNNDFRISVEATT